MNQIRFFSLAASLCLTTLLWASVACSQETPLLCALNQALECGPEAGCTQRTMANVNLPDFIHIDLQKNKIQAFGAPESSQGTTIKSIENLAGKVILLGAEKGRGWTIDLDEKTGKFTAAVAEDQAGFIIFGTCLQQ